MKNKGFTLVELLGVIVLLGLLGVVIIPRVGDSINNSKNQAYNVQMENIKKGVKDFLIDNTYVMEDSETITIKLGVLKQGGYLPINIKNPITKKDFSNESLITIKNTNNNYDIELSLKDLENVNENVDNNSPILVLNGNYIEYVNVFDKYTEKGATARTSSGETIDNISIQIKLNDEEKPSIETTELATYNVIYSATDQEGHTTSATRTVIIRDNEAPKITLPKETTLHVSEVAGYNLREDVIVTDNYDKNLDIKVDSSLSNIVGKYVITYTATDSSGNETIERRVINVIEDSYVYYYDTKYVDEHPVYFNPTTGRKCNEVEYNNNPENLGKTGCMKWYAYSEYTEKDGQIYINMLLDHNTTAKVNGWVSSDDYYHTEDETTKPVDVGISYSNNLDGREPDGEYGTLGNNNKGPLTVLKQLQTDTDGWALLNRADSYTVNNKNGDLVYKIDYSRYKARLISAEEVNRITKRNTTIYSISNDYFDLNCDREGKCSQNKNLYAWLFTNTSNCESYGCKNNHSSTYGYWSSSPCIDNSSSSWDVILYGILDERHVYDTYYGVRPVITVSKSSIY